MEFHRKYQCQDAAEDSLSVKPLDDDMLRFVNQSDEEVQSAHLNRPQVTNLIELLTALVDTVPGQVENLWEDVG